MAYRYSPTELITKLRSSITQIGNTMRVLQAVNSLQDSYYYKFDRGIAEVEVEAQALLDAAEEILVTIDAELTEIRALMLFQVFAQPFAGNTFSSVAVDVNDGGGTPRGVLTANAGAPFASFAISDVVEITESENGNEGEYIVLSKTDTVLTLTTVLVGTDNAADTTIKVTLKQR